MRRGNVPVESRSSLTIDTPLDLVVQAARLVIAPTGGLRTATTFSSPAGPASSFTPSLVFTAPTASLRGRSVLARSTLLTGAPEPARVAPADPIVGRTAELARLRTLLGEAAGGRSPGVVLTGPAGIGKTALARACVPGLDDIFPDGTIELRLRDDRRTPLPPSNALAGMLKQLGTPTAALPRNLAERSALCRTLLQGRRLLILLDDVPGEAWVRPLLPPTGCAVLVTSRRMLPGLTVDGMRVLPMKQLSAEDGDLLFRTCSRATRSARPSTGNPWIIRTLAAEFRAEQSTGHPLPQRPQYWCRHQHWPPHAPAGQAGSIRACALAIHARLPDALRSALNALLRAPGGGADPPMLAALLSCSPQRAAVLLAGLAERELAERAPHWPHYVADPRMRQALDAELSAAPASYGFGPAQHAPDRPDRTRPDRVRPNQVRPGQVRHGPTQHGPALLDLLAEQATAIHATLHGTHGPVTLLDRAVANSWYACRWPAAVELADLAGRARHPGNPDGPKQPGNPSHPGVGDPGDSARAQAALTRLALALCPVAVAEHTPEGTDRIYAPALTGPNPPRRLYALSALALECRGRPAAALRVLRSWRTDDRRSERLEPHQLMLGEMSNLHLQLGHLTAAERLLSRAVDDRTGRSASVGPGQLALWHDLLGRTRSARGRPVEALASHARALELRGGAPTGVAAVPHWRGTGDACRALGQHDTAQDAYRRMLQSGVEALAWSAGMASRFHFSSLAAPSAELLDDIERTLALPLAQYRCELLQADEAPTDGC